MKHLPMKKSLIDKLARLTGYLMVLLLVSVSSRLFAGNNFPKSNSAHTPYQYSLIIDEITCQGNQQIDCDFITNKYYQRVGEKLDPDEIEEAKLRLGSLNHFTDVSVHLRKGSQRGHVIVVFEVVEADSLQFEFTTFIENYSRDRNRCNDLPTEQGTIEIASDGTDVEQREFFTRLTDYNAFGSGKQLSLSLVQQQRTVSNNNIINPDNSFPGFFSIFDFCSSNFALGKYESDQLTTIVEYYDPHFLNSKKLFFIGQYEHNYIDSEFNYFDFSNTTPVEEHESFQDNESYIAVAIGSRFANYSFFSISLQNYLNESESGVGASYGWNSQDDVLFPTSGSFFKVQQGIERDGSKTIDISFQKNHLLPKDLILSWGIGDGFLNSSSHQLGSVGSDFSASKTDNVAFVKIGSVIFKDDTSGAISGWNFGLIGEERKGLGYMANYVYHTDKLIINLGLNYFPSEESD